MDIQVLARRKLRALIIEDNEHMRVLLRRLLQRIGIECKEYQDGSETLAALEREKPDVILTDYSMEPMDGITFVRALRRLENSRIRATPVIMVTGHTARERIVAARDAGVNEILAKPVTEGGLHSRIQEAVLRTRQWVETSTYCGPCRRRRLDPHYRGPERRRAMERVEI
jgi:CheY-like chemotaxis protein